MFATNEEEESTESGKELDIRVVKLKNGENLGRVPGTSNGVMFDRAGRVFGISFIEQSTMSRVIVPWNNVHLIIEEPE